ncbi:hypothetical protein EVAR_80628_1 [Eumeta japonica]|uniref:Uncharacterized protein n=1 Tax=Eumeta variegata TaxID=151549 RepID=A0A4C1YR48_EUMVA|nr:hypothetical protein EVAR_80628_1 [Eumeta japonica]
MAAGTTRPSSIANGWGRKVAERRPRSDRCGVRRLLIGWTEGLVKIARWLLVTHKTDAGGAPVRKKKTRPSRLSTEQLEDSHTKVQLFSRATRRRRRRRRAGKRDLFRSSIDHTAPRSVRLIETEHGFPFIRYLNEIEE